MKETGELIQVQVKEHSAELYLQVPCSAAGLLLRATSPAGAKVAVCELPFDYKSSESKGGVGGTCVLRGCVPKKVGPANRLEIVCRLTRSHVKLMHAAPRVCERVR
jgi:hypothetical protein